MQLAIFHCLGRKINSQVSKERIARQNKGLTMAAPKEEDNKEDDEEENEQGRTLCGSCSDNDGNDKLWICYDVRDSCQIIECLPAQKEHSRIEGCKGNSKRIVFQLQTCSEMAQSPEDVNKCLDLKLSPCVNEPTKCDSAPMSCPTDAEVKVKHNFDLNSMPNEDEVVRVPRDFDLNKFHQEAGDLHPDAKMNKWIVSWLNILIPIAHWTCEKPS